MARKNKQKWEYEEENYYGVRPSQNTSRYQKPRRRKTRSAAEDNNNFEVHEEEE